MHVEKDNDISNRNLYESEDAVHFYEKEGFVDNEEEIILNVLALKSVRILDLGCGTGRTTKALYDLGFTNILGADYSLNMVKLAKEKYPAIRFTQEDATSLSFSDESFDVVLFLYQGIDCIESDKERLAAYHEIFRILRPGGIFLHSAHNSFWLNKRFRTTWIPFLKSLITGKVFSSHYRSVPHAYGNETLAFRSMHHVKKELLQSGFVYIKSFPSRKGSIPLFQPYRHYLAKKPGDQ